MRKIAAGLFVILVCLLGAGRADAASAGFTSCPTYASWEHNMAIEYVGTQVAQSVYVVMTNGNGGWATVATTRVGVQPWYLGGKPIYRSVGPWPTYLGDGWNRPAYVYMNAITVSSAKCI